ncbi:MAG: amidohydrolase family protein [Pseudolabrys sp.]|nr:amidohydrolase family protein [Pseudolabrys sp.]
MTPLSAATMTKPKLRAPAGTADCHIHIYGPADKYSLAATAPYPPPLATVSQYRVKMRQLNIDYTVIVQPGAYGPDNRCTLDALEELGSAARAITVVTPDTPRAEIARMNQLGVRGARFMLLPRGSVVTWEMLVPVANLIADFGWHVQLQFDGRDLPNRIDMIRGLPCPVVIDHNGKFFEPVAPEHPAMQSLLRLLDTRRVWVKTSAPYETSKAGPPLYEDVGVIARSLIRAAPDRIVWASNWPHGGRDQIPDDAMLLDTLLDWAPNDMARQKILVENPKQLYGF